MLGNRRILILGWLSRGGAVAQLRFPPFSIMVRRARAVYTTLSDSRSRSSRRAWASMFRVSARKFYALLCQLDLEFLAERSRRSLQSRQGYGRVGGIQEPL